MDAAIRTKDLTFTYDNAQAPALRGVNIEVERGSFTVIMGRTGAGKTTLAMLTNGIIPQVVEGKVEGSVESAGLDISRYRVQTVAQQVGLVLQDPETQIFGRTVWEDVAFGPRNYLVPREEILRRITDALAKVRLSGYEQRLTSELSGGEKQRLAIAGGAGDESLDPGAGRADLRARPDRPGGDLPHDVQPAEGAKPHRPRGGAFEPGDLREGGCGHSAAGG